MRAAFIFLLFISTDPAQADSQALHYDVTITEHGVDPAQVAITLFLSGDEDGETELVLPRSWGGEDRLWQAIAELDVAGGTLFEGDDPAQRTVRHAPGAPLSVSWHVIQDRAGRPEAIADNNYRPWIQPGYVHFLGHTVFITPAERETDTVRVVFDYPEEWALASDLEHGVSGLVALEQSVIVAGDFSVETAIIEGAHLRVAVRGNMNAGQIMLATQAAVGGNFAYWGADGSPYLVTGLPLIVAPGRSSFGGTNLLDSFALFGTSDVPPELVQRILVHEHAHSWVPAMVGGLPDGADEPMGYWFSEGFTDFVATRAGLLAGAWSIEGAIGQWNEFLSEYMASPVREAPNTVIRDDFWTDAGVQRLPYLRGNVFAALIDHSIRIETSGAMDFDDVLVAMRENPPSTSGAEGFVEAVREVTGLDIADLHRQHIVNGETIILARDTFGACGVVEAGVEPVFDYGMELDGREDGEGFVITAVDPDGPAAGIFEPGMILLERVAGAIGDATQRSAFRMLIEGEEQVLSYLPTNGETAPIQRLVPAPGASRNPSCFERLAGRATD